ncbi:MAG: 4-alpha-glucanotransferase [Acidobacteria bacterium]|nr:4-alpha-glucanotransferase [Acidobacteriota bacterium]
MRLPRASGVLLHPVSLPGEFGIGELGDEATEFIEFLAASGQHLWQVLPLGPTGYGESPYQGLSSFAGNTLLISPRRLVSMGLLSDADLAAHETFPAERVAYESVKKFKATLLHKAYENFARTGDAQLLMSFQEFCGRAALWLEDYALYRALKNAHGEQSWYDWEPELALREPQALERARAELREEINAQKFYQYLFFRQWHAVRALCRERGIKIIGDLPIFVAHDSADVWANPQLFKLDEARRPVVVAGVPPDYFSRTGQLWGNPIYDWERLRAEGFRWWIERIRAMFELYDIVRLDHFRGFAAAWEVPSGAPTAEHGQWVHAPGRELFNALRQALGELPLIAEDLGVITPDVEALRDDFGFQGMRILQFAFGSDTQNPHLPHRYVNNAVVYTGTHDNDTTRAWFKELTKNKEDYAQRTRDYCLRYLGTKGREIHWDMIRAALSSVADTAITPLQDILGLGAEARMNLPSTKGDNWNWRFREGLLTAQLSERLRELTETYGRT